MVISTFKGGGVGFGFGIGCGFGVGWGFGGMPLNLLGLGAGGGLGLGWGFGTAFGSKYRPHGSHFKECILIARTKLTAMSSQNPAPKLEVHGDKDGRTPVRGRGILEVNGKDDTKEFDVIGNSKAGQNMVLKFQVGVLQGATLQGLDMKDVMGKEYSTEEMSAFVIKEGGGSKSHAF